MHLAAEDVDAALEADSGRALQRIPAAVQEVSLLHVRRPALPAFIVSWKGFNQRDADTGLQGHFPRQRCPVPVDAT